ncbi:HK97 gp10 family phage protein [Rhodopseudomonas parapalustris]
MKFDINDLAKAIASELEEYTQKVTDGVKKGIDTVAKETNQTIKEHVTFKQPTGDYVKSFRIKTSYEDRFNKRKTWYVASPYYRLSHLLENGHALRNGKRSRKFPHIIYGEELAQKRMEEIAKEAIKDAGR